MHGSPGLTQTLLAADLVDELRLILFPVTLGTGKRLFGEGTRPRGWRLTSATGTPTGAVICTYQRAGEVDTGTMTPRAGLSSVTPPGGPLCRGRRPG